MRRDGIRYRNEKPMYQVAAYIMNKRVDSMNMITLDIPQDPMVEYVHRKRDEGVLLSRLAVVMAAYVRVLAEFPKLNHFVVNSKLYARKEISVGMVVLKGSMTDGGTMSKIYLLPTDTIFEVQKKLTEYIEANRREDPKNGTEKMIKILLSVPGLVRGAVALFRWMDKHGLLPKKLIDMSPFHISLLLTDLASIRTDSIYHHVYEFGTTSIAAAMGNSREVPKRKGGEIIFQKCMPIGFVMDERIADGSYFAIAFRRFQDYMKHPEKLEQPPEVIDEEIRKIFKIEEK
ncbi:MAG: hypothetical protein IJC46_01805 [Clostridia bacterium]|nr:hypothetical protein [Clostridia bacterium]